VKPTIVSNGQRSTWGTELNANQDFNFKLGWLEIVVLAPFIAWKRREDSGGSWTAAKEAGRETFRAHLSFAPGFMKCFIPSTSTGIRAWKDVPAWPVDTQDNTRIKKRRCRDGICYFWIKYGRDIKVFLESDLRAETFFRCFSKAKYVFLMYTFKIHKHNLKRNATRNHKNKKNYMNLKAVLHWEK